ncbi:MAG: biotin--[acetyl-CoA-carboxylase] ligase [Nitrospirota bacterium]
MISVIGDLSANEIEVKAKGLIGKNIILLETVDSTNTFAADLAEKVEDGTVVVADSQKKGRGRLGRTWISPPGSNIYLSVITKPSIHVEDGTLITVMAGVSCVHALRRSTGLDVAIKWPNDIVYGDKKLGGILTELRTQDERIIFAIIGIGINVNVSLDILPEDVREIATSLRNETGGCYSRTEIIAEILNELDRWYRIMKEKGGSNLILEWQRLNSTLGKKVMVIAGNETYGGFAESIDEKGMLILRLPSGETRKISAGDLKILRHQT